MKDRALSHEYKPLLEDKKNYQELLLKNCSSDTSVFLEINQWFPLPSHWIIQTVCHCSFMNSPWRRHTLEVMVTAGTRHG